MTQSGLEIPNTTTNKPTNTRCGAAPGAAQCITCDGLQLGLVVHSLVTLKYDFRDGLQLGLVVHSLGTLKYDFRDGL